MYAIDISDPSKPIVTDSLVANTRRVNDVMTTPDGKFLVLHARGRSRPEERHRDRVARRSGSPQGDRRVHRRRHRRRPLGLRLQAGPKYGTHVYLTNDGTGCMHVIDINDPYHPKEVARWKTDPARCSRQHAARHRRAGRAGVRELLESTGW